MTIPSAIIQILPIICKYIIHILKTGATKFEILTYSPITNRSTVRVFEILSRAQYYWKIDSRLIANIKKWIRNNQKEEGYFANTIKSSLEERVAVTAETLSTYVEVGFHEVGTTKIK